MAWWYAIIWVVAMVAAYCMMPKAQSQPPPEFDDIDAPTAEEGREVPVLFGTRDIDGPNVVWYGDIRTKSVKGSGGKK